MSTDSQRGSRRLAVRNWRVSTRLYAILLIPVVVALVFGGLQVRSSVDTWREAQDAERTAQLVRAAATYGHLLIDERDLTAEPLLSGDTENPVIDRARNATDTAREEFEHRVKEMPDQEGLNRRLAAFRDAEPGLAPLREAAYTEQLSGVETEEGYVTVQHALMEFANELGLGTGSVTSYGRTVYAISLAKAAESLQRAIGTHLLVKPASNEREFRKQLTAMSSYAYLEGIALIEYRSGSSAAQLRRMEVMLSKAENERQQKVTAAAQAAQEAGQDYVKPPSKDQMVELISSGASPRELAAQGVTPESWFQSATSVFDVYRAIEQEMTDEVLQETKEIASSSQREALINAAAMLAALIVAFVVAAMMARSMSRSMLRLRSAAFEVAQERLPAVVDQLSRTAPGRVDTRVSPIPIDTRDEIGEVARAFDQVHREAVRLAAEQALLRGNVNAIFTNLSQRNQGLIERQLELISDLESREAEPDQLENLFRLDHLATRMRRNGENLLVLAGEEPGRRWDQPVPLVDVLRAAASEVEQYARIELTGMPETDVHGTAVTDLVHLLAELLENATTFSSPQSKIRVAASRLPDSRVMIEIHDRGIGLTGEDFASINHKLANPPAVDAAISQRMGLYVVGRLADRHGIRVQLRPSGEQAGTTSLVMLPGTITHGGGGEAEVEPDFTVSRIVPAPHQGGDPVHDSQSAAAHGFDDSRYEGQRSLLDPGARSLQRGAHRAALTTQQPEQPLDDRPPSGTGSPPRHAGAPAHPDPIDYGQPAQQPPNWGHFADSPAADYERVSEDAYPSAGPAAEESQPSFFGDQPNRPPGIPYDSGYPAIAEPAGPNAPPETGNRVGFHHPGPSPGSYHTTTGAGLPRRERRGQPSEDSSAAGTQPQAEPSEQPRNPGQQDDSDWSASNDGRWQRAGQLRDPQAGGVTGSGLPRRVPRANLVEGTAAQAPQGGPQVSRAPEDVRGRLSNLHRGVRRGRSQDRGRNDRQGLGPGGRDDQER